MLRVQKTINISPCDDCTTPFTYFVNVSCQEAASCIVPVKPTGQLFSFGDHILDFDVDPNCNLAACTVNVTVNTSNGCSSTTQLQFDDVCSDLDVSISRIGSYRFNAVVENGSPEYTYEWTYDENFFTAIFSTQNEVIILTPRPNIANFPLNSQVCLTVTDSTGCVKNTCETFDICQSTTSTVTNIIAINCDNEGIVTLSSRDCPDTTMNWDTMYISKISDNNGNQYTTSAISIVDITDQMTASPVSTALVEFTVNNNILTTSPGLYQVFYNATNSDGILSTQGFFWILMPTDCTPDGPESGGPTPGPPPVNTCECQDRVECGETVLRIPVTQCVPLDCVDTGGRPPNEGTCLDRSSFMFIYPVGVGFGPFTTDLGNTVEYDPSTNEIIFTVVGGGAVDKVEFIICDTEGECTGTVTLYINLDCFTLPVLTDDDYCILINETTVLDILANDTIPNPPGVDLDSFILLTTPQFGIANWNSTTGMLEYTPDPSSNGEIEVLTYNIATLDGVYATTPATITITIGGVGSDGDTTLCN
jgi:hypothetical protein